MAAVRTQTCQRHTAALGTLCSEFFLLRFYLSVLGGILLPDIVSRHLPISSLLKYSFFITIDTNERIRVLQVISVQQMKPLHANG